MGNHDDCFGVYNIADIINRLVAVLLDSNSLLNHRRLGLPCFASLDTLVPGVLKLCVVNSPAGSEPRTATSTTAEFAGFLDGATCEARGTGSSRRGY